MKKLDPSELPKGFLQDHKVLELGKVCAVMCVLLGSKALRGCSQCSRCAWFWDRSGTAMPNGACAVQDAIIGEARAPNMPLEA